MTILVTGAAGFIGFHVSKRLLELGVRVIGFDGFTPYYDVQLKRDRAAILEKYPAFQMVEGNLEDSALLTKLTVDEAPEIVIHLAAQAGVRYSIENPASYVSSNLDGTANLLEALRAAPPKHFLFASTSSVYGSNPSQPFREIDRTDFPVSLYAATKRSGEALTHSYAHLFGIPTTCFRFFTVYGPWGRPDMALFKFVQLIKHGKEIDVYGRGEMSRDFTYIEDLVGSILALMDQIPAPNTSFAAADTVSPSAPWRVVNIGGGSPRKLWDFIDAIERKMGTVARKNLLPMQPGDVVSTYADTELLQELTGSKPATSLEDGVSAFVDWHESYYESTAS